MLAYAVWGLFPVYFKWLQHVAALQLVGHRVVWSFVALAGVVLVSRQARALAAFARSPRVLALYAAAAGLIGVNWLVFVWAVNNDHVVQTSLGYFITPLVSVLIGVLVLRERLRRWQWAAVLLAAAGVLQLTASHGAPLWIALALALSFGLYGLVKKKAPLAAVPGLTLETAILLPPAVAYLLYLEHAGEGAFLRHGALTGALLIGAGVLTAAPLLLFASAAQRIPLSLIGILQYIAPSLHLLLGVVFYREPFGVQQLAGFALVWLALFVFAADGMRSRRASARGERDEPASDSGG